MATAPGQRRPGGRGGGGKSGHAQSGFTSIRRGGSPSLGGGGTGKTPGGRWPCAVWAVGMILATSTLTYSAVQVIFG